MLNKNKHNRSLWKLFIVSPLLVVFFLLFQVETKAQIKNSITTTESKVNRVEMTFDENTTKEDLESTVDFLKEDFNIDMKYSNLEFDTNGKLKSIALEVNSNDGFKGSVTSPDVAELPVYFYRDYTEGEETPFGVGIRTESETPSKTDYNSIKDAEHFIINAKKIDKEELVKTYIPVEDYSYDSGSKTLSITTKSQFSEPYFKGLSEALKKLKERYGERILEEFTFINVTSDYKVNLITMSKFKISSNAENASQYDSPNQIFSSELDDDNIIYLVDGKEVDQDRLNDIKPDQIESVDVKKSVPLIKANGYDPDQVKGIIQITTKKANSKNASQFQNLYKTNKPTIGQNDDRIIYLVDGKEVDEKKFYKLEPEQIQSMEVVKSAIVLKKEGFDPNKIDGLIIVTTKSKDSQQTNKINNN